MRVNGAKTRPDMQGPVVVEQLTFFAETVGDGVALLDLLTAYEAGVLLTFRAGTTEIRFAKGQRPKREVTG